MAAIPTSDLPGHKPLHERVCAALDHCEEAQDTEFKESTPWENLQIKIVKTAMGMANLRGGGIIVIGASEREKTWNLDGITSEHLSNYDPDNVTAAVNKYASPHVDLTVVQVKYQNKNFLAIEIDEFDMSPVVCKKAYENELRVGDVYVRPVGQVRTTRLNDAKDSHDLLDLAVEKRARRIIQTAKRIGLEARDTDEDAFAREQKEMANQRRVLTLNTAPHWQIIIRPTMYEPDRINGISKLWRTIEGTQIKRRGWDYPLLLRPDEYQLQGNNWV